MARVRVRVAGLGLELETQTDRGIDRHRDTETVRQAKVERGQTVMER